MISKPRITNMRCLTALSLNDKIVASAIKIVLNAIFEKQEGLNMLHQDRYFHSFSHGFRSNRGCHSALDVTTTWGLTPWFIKADISKYYDSIDQKRLISILKKSINDQLLVDTLYKFFKISVKNLNAGKSNTNKGVGIPQSNPLSPVLANVYLNELDHFVDCLKKKIDESSLGKTTKE